MAVDVVSLAREAKLIRSGLPLQELARRAQLVERLERQFGEVKTDALNAGNAAKTANTEAKNATKTANTLRGQVTQDLRRLGDEITKTYDKLNGPLERVTKGMDKWINLISGVLGVAGVVISLMALKASEANQAAFDRSINLAAIEGQRQGSINQLLANRIKENKAELAKTNKRIDVLNREADLASNAIKLARSWADRAYKLANDGLYESRTKIKRLNDVVAEARSNASKALQGNTALKQNVSLVETKIRTIDVKATTIAADVQQAKVGVKLVDSKATTALATAQQLPAKIPIAVNNAIAPLKPQIQQAQTTAQQAKAENPPQNQRIAELENKVRAIQNAPKVNTGNSTGTGTNEATVNQAQINRYVNNSIAGMGILPRLTAAQVTADAALARSTAALGKPEIEPIGRNALALGSNNSAAIDKLNQDIQQLKAPNILEPRLRTVETKVREQEKVNQEANNKLDGLTLQQALLPAAILAGLTPALQGINTNLSNLGQTLPDKTASAVSAAPCNGRGCGGRTAQRVDDLAGEMGALRNQVNGLPNTVGNVVNGANAVANGAQLGLLNTINNKLGAPVPGGIGGVVSGLSTKLNKLGSWLGIDRVMNALILFTTIHNAAMLSGQLGTTLLEVISQGLAVFQIKDLDGNPIDLNSAIGQGFEAFLKSVVGQENYTKLSTTWAKASRVYQAAANVVSTVSSIQQATLSAVEIVSSQSSKIGNALRAYGAVGEKAYGWMNPNPNFDNRFFTALEKAEDGASMVLSVTSDVLTAQEQLLQLEKDKDEYRAAQKGLKQDGTPVVPGFEKLEFEPKKAAEDARKAFVKAANIDPNSLKASDGDT